MLLQLYQNQKGNSPLGARLLRWNCGWYGTVHHGLLIEVTEGTNLSSVFIERKSIHLIEYIILS